MKFIFYFFLLSISSFAQITEIEVYHISFFEEFNAGGGPYEEGIKTYQGCKKFKSKDKSFKKEIKQYLSKLDTVKKYTDLSGGLGVQLLIEVKYRFRKTKRIYSWGSGEIFYNKKLYETDLEFMRMIEKYYPNDISWSDDRIDKFWK